MKIAVIGSGISGLAAAFYLSKKYKVDLFEKENHFGGHSYTYDIKHRNKILPVDLGFIVFNELTYPNLINFFKELNVPFEKSDMSFSVSIQNHNVEYGGKGLNAIFANRNLTDPSSLYKISLAGKPGKISTPRDSACSANHLHRLARLII